MLQSESPESPEGCLNAAWLWIGTRDATRTTALHAKIPAVELLGFGWLCGGSENIWKRSGARDISLSLLAHSNI